MIIAIENSVSFGVLNKMYADVRVSALSLKCQTYLLMKGATFCLGSL